MILLRSRRVQSFVLLVRVPKSVFVSSPLLLSKLNVPIKETTTSCGLGTVIPKSRVFAITSHCYDLLFIVRRSNSSECSFMYLSKAS